MTIYFLCNNLIYFLQYGITSTFTKNPGTRETQEEWRARHNIIGTSKSRRALWSHCCQVPDTHAPRRTWSEPLFLNCIQIIIRNRCFKDEWSVLSISLVKFTIGQVIKHVMVYYSARVYWTFVYQIDHIFVHIKLVYLWL